MNQCALCGTEVLQYVSVGAIGQVFCLPDVISLLGQVVEGGWLEGKEVTTMEQFWQQTHDITFANIGY